MNSLISLRLSTNNISGFGRSTRSWFAKVLAACFILCAFAMSGYSQAALPNTWVTNDAVENITRGDGKVFISGPSLVGEYYGSASFRGLNNNGNELPAGSYYYRIDFKDGRTSRTGYLSLRK